jgi:hypothetical protein
MQHGYGVACQSSVFLERGGVSCAVLRSPTPASLRAPETPTPTSPAGLDTDKNMPTYLVPCTLHPDRQKRQMVSRSWGSGRGIGGYIVAHSHGSFIPYLPVAYMHDINSGRYHREVGPDKSFTHRRSSFTRNGTVILEQVF